MEEKIKEEFGKSWDIDWDSQREEEAKEYMKQTLRDIKENLFSNETDEKKIEEIKACIHDFERECGNV